MGLSNELISQFAKITNDKKTSRVDEVTLYGEVVKCDDTIYVKFDGSDELTPVTTVAEKDEDGNIVNFKYGAASVKTGDRVSVVLKNHSATITGNLTDPPMGRAEVKVTEDSIVAKVGEDVKVQIDELGVKVNGLTTFTNETSAKVDGLSDGLSKGTTTIDGGCIKTGTIDAERLNLTGAIAFGDLNSEVQNGITSAQQTANDAQTAASNAQSAADSAESAANSALDTVNALDEIVSDWGYRYKGTTYIDGEKIMTGTVTASSLQGGEVRLLDADELTAAALTLTGAASYNGAKLAITSGAIELDALFGDVFISSGDGGHIQISDDIACQGDLRPRDNESGSLGTSAFKWSDVYASNGTIITSDANAKKDVIRDLTAYDGFFNALTPCTYKLIDGESGRIHLGMISQDVEKALYECNISSMDFAGFVKSPKKDDNGNVIDGEFTYALRYSEFIPLLIWQVQKLKARVAELEETHG